MHTINDPRGPDSGPGTGMRGTDLGIRQDRFQYKHARVLLFVSLT